MLTLPVATLCRSMDGALTQAWGFVLELCVGNFPTAAQKGYHLWFFSTWAPAVLIFRKKSRDTCVFGFNTFGWTGKAKVSKLDAIEQFCLFLLCITCWSAEKMRAQFPLRCSSRFIYLQYSLSIPKWDVQQQSRYVFRLQIQLQSGSVGQTINNRATSRCLVSVASSEDI